MLEAPLASEAGQAEPSNWWPEASEATQADRPLLLDCWLCQAWADRKPVPASHWSVSPSPGLWLADQCPADPGPVSPSSEWLWTNFCQFLATGWTRHLWTRIQVLRLELEPENNRSANPIKKQLHTSNKVNIFDGKLSRKGKKQGSKNHQISTFL